MFRTSKILSQEKVQARAGRLFIAPSMTVFTLFVFIPLIASFVFSFLKTNLMFRNMDFVGFSNYAKMFADSRFWNALGNTVYYTVCVVPAQVILALLVAVVLKRQQFFQIGIFPSGDLFHDCDRDHLVLFAQ